MLRHGLAVSLVVLFGVVAPARAATVTVDVTTTADVTDAGDGVTSLREALATANAGTDDYVIRIPAGQYAVGATLDIDGVSASVTLRGAGARSTVLDGGGADGVLAIAPGENVTVEDLTVTDGASGEGGGIFNQGTTTLRRVTVSDNSASLRGGGIFTDNEMLVEQSTISGNDATNPLAPGGRGGGILNDGALRLRSVTVSGNTAFGTGGVAPGQGGGIFSTPTSSAVLEYATLAGNVAQGASNNAGGNLFGEGGAPATETFNSLLVAGVPENCSGPGTTSPSSGDGTMASDGSCLGRAATPGLALGPLADNGGPTDTLALLSGNPAIDFQQACEYDNRQGHPAIVTDQRGLPRPINGACDMGAFEVQPPPPPTTTDTQDPRPPAPPPAGPLPSPPVLLVPGPPASPPALAPLRSLRLTPSRFRRSRGTTVRLDAAAAARIRFTVEKLSPGRRVANRCVKPAGSNRARAGCTRRVNVTGSFVRTVRAGASRFTWRGRVGVSTLRPGRYQLVAVVTDGARRSVARRASFTVTRR